MAITALSLSLVGCDEEKPKVTLVPKAETAADLKRLEQMMPSAAPPPLVNPGPATGVTLQWSVPAGWQRQPDAPMRYATFKFGPEGAQAELSVSTLPPGSGDTLRNLRRWRGQLGLPDGTDEELMAGVSAPFTVDGAQVRLMNILGPENPVAPPTSMAPPGTASQPATAPSDKPLVQQRMLTAILTRPGDVWFFKLLGPAAMVEAQKATFASFVQSVKFVEKVGQPGAAMPPALPAAPHTHANAGPAPGIDAWQLPPGWETFESPSSFRVASLRIAGNKPAESAEIAITSFAGGIGTLLANINRWRGQVGLEPVGDVKDQPAEALSGTADPCVVFDLLGLPGQPAEKRHIVVAMVLHGDQAWFVKLTGNDAAVAAQKPALMAFLRSLRFSGPATSEAPRE